MYTGYDIISGLNTSELTFPKRWTEPSLAAASVARLLIVANAGKVDYQRWKRVLSLSPFSCKTRLKFVYNVKYHLTSLSSFLDELRSEDNFEKPSTYRSDTSTRCNFLLCSLSSESGCTTRDSLRTKPSLVIRDRTCLYAVVRDDIGAAVKYRSRPPLSRISPCIYGCKDVQS